MEIKNILFDFDGTLADTAPGIVAAELAMFEKLGIPAPSEEVIRGGIGVPLRESIEYTGCVPEDKLDEAVEIYRELFYIHEKGKTSLYPGVIETLEALKARGIRMAIATSRSARSLNMYMERWGIAGYFETWTTADDNFNPKPAPDLVLALLSRMGIDKDETLVIGDTIFDIGMGASAGCRTCAVTYGNHSKSRLIASSPTYIIDSLPELLSLV